MGESFSLCWWTLGRRSGAQAGKAGMQSEIFISHVQSLNLWDAAKLEIASIRNASTYQTSLLFRSLFYVLMLSWVAVALPLASKSVSPRKKLPVAERIKCFG
jgi:hypothetical protein